MSIILGAAGEMAQWLRPLVALPDDLGSVPRTQIKAHNCLYLQVKKSQFPLLASVGIAYTWYTDLCEGKPLNDH